MQTATAMNELAILDSVEILAIVDNEVDTMAQSHPNISTSGQMRSIAIRSGFDIQGRGGAKKEMRMNNICCGAHGLSLMITAIKGHERRTVLFDTGPEEDIWARNAQRLRVDLAAIDTIVLSHWHRDHSGGMLQAIRMINDARWHKKLSKPITADLHPDRPTYRGIMMKDEPVSMEADPAFEEIGGAGAIVDRRAETHLIGDDMFLVSGEIPRVTPFETGLKNGIRFDNKSATWEKDEAMLDERYVLCRVKDKGLVLFTGCSHGGAINACKDALNLTGGGVPLYAVIGGFHLADADGEKITNTIKAFKELGVSILLPGHCSGWRANLEIEKQMPGQLSPCKVGIQFTI